MSTLHRRIARQPTAGRQAMGDFHPVAPQPMDWSVVRVTFTGDGATIEEMVPLWTADGAPVPATGPGHWDQLYAAGSP